jgi:hypothetical protein
VCTTRVRVRVCVFGTLARSKAAHEDALTGFATLLGELVREPFGGAFRDWRPRLERDPQASHDEASLD